MNSETTIKERPILFSGEMVRAILSGRKSQTRRIVKPQPVARVRGSVIGFAMDDDDWAWSYKGQPHRATISNKKGGPDGYLAECPYGQPGDRLWVRETHMIHGGEIAYAATDQPLVGCDKWRPSIHIPRWASRITLDVTSVRLERLQDITEHDAELEGAAACEHFADAKRGHPLQPHKTSFAWLWNKINGRESWIANPWVWVVGFTRVLEEPAHG